MERYPVISQIAHLNCVYRAIHVGQRQATYQCLMLCGSCIAKKQLLSEPKLQKSKCSCSASGGFWRLHGLQLHVLSSTHEQVGLAKKVVGSTLDLPDYLLQPCFYNQAQQLSGVVTSPQTTSVPPFLEPTLEQHHKANSYRVISGEGSSTVVV